MTTDTLNADPYWSRLESHWEIVPREDPVVWDDGRHGPLTSQELAQFEEQGYRFTESLFSPAETERILHEVRTLQQHVPEQRSGVIREPNSRAVRSIFRFHEDHAFLKSVCQDPRLVEPVRQILGSDVYVHQSRINFKPAFDGKEFFWHSDFETWHIEDGMPRMRAVSVSVALTENNEFNGPLMVVPGSHRQFVRCQGETPENHFEQSLRKQEYGVPSCGAMEQLVNAGGITAPKGPGGSALFFECNLMHGSASNLSPFPRTNLFIVYNSVDNRVVQPFGHRPPRPDFLASRQVVPVGEL